MKRSEFKQFLLKIVAICFFLFCFFLFDAVLTGSFPFMVGLLLLPGICLFTSYIFQLSLRPVRKKKKRVTLVPPPASAAFYISSKQNKPTLSTLTAPKVA